MLHCFHNELAIDLFYKHEIMADTIGSGDKTVDDVEGKISAFNIDNSEFPTGDWEDLPNDPIKCDVNAIQHDELSLSITFGPEDSITRRDTWSARRPIAVSRARVECVGLHWWNYYNTTNEAFAVNADEFDDIDDDDDLAASGFDEDNVVYLRSLDPREWKAQDHYAVLGLKKLRYKATEDDIKRAYRLKVLKHHPDKRRAAGEEIRPDDDYFTCITKAWETLGNSRNRRAYDSIDPEFDDSLPSVNDNTKDNFYQVYGKAFERNSRWSLNHPVPKLGDENTPRDAVDRFYRFWYNFESWREFSYLDEEDKEMGQAREERRWIDRLNKAARAKRKKEENARIRCLVDNAYGLDPRIKAFKEEEKRRKQEAKAAKREAVRIKLEEEERKFKEFEEAARRQKEQEAAEEKARQEAIKAEREAQKKALKQQRANLRKIVKSNNYFSNSEEEKISNMASLENLCESQSADQLKTLSDKILSEGCSAFINAVKEIEQKIEMERLAQLESTKSHNASLNLMDNCGRKGGGAPWSTEQLQLLIKAVNVFPAGTNQRWEVVANFINQHDPGSNVMRTPKEVLLKAKDLQNTDFSKSFLKVQVNQKAFDTFEKEHQTTTSNPIDTASTSKKSESPVQQTMLPWTAAEQQLLEQALKTYPSNTLDRWDRIAECLPSRTKRDCMKRFKDLAEMVKAKKAAQAAAVSSTPKPSK